MDVSLFCCYSIDLRNFLRNNGLKYKIVAKNPNSQNIFWVYIRDEKLDVLLNEWSAKK